MSRFSLTIARDLQLFNRFHRNVRQTPILLWEVSEEKSANDGNVIESLKERLL